MSYGRTLLLYRNFSANDGTVPYLQMVDGEILRTMSWGANWQHIRVGLQFAVNSFGYTSPTRLGFTIGVCSGNQGFGSAATTNFVGATPFSGTTTAAEAVTFNYTANSGNPYWQESTPGMGGIFTKVGSPLSGFASPTTAGNALAFPENNSGATAIRRAVWFFDLQKGTSTDTFTIFFDRAATGNMATDFRNFTFLNFMEHPNQNNMTDPYSSLNNRSNTATTAASDAIGPLDTLDLCWASSQIALEIYQLAVLKIA